MVIYFECVKKVQSKHLPHFSDLEHLYHPDSKTYDVTTFASGVTINVMEALARACNFTLQVHLREDRKWGTIKVSNGTFQYATGMYDSLLNGNGKFEILASAMIRTPERDNYLQFLHPISGDRHAIVVKNDFDNEFDFEMFLQPLALEVWILIIVLGFVPPLIMSVQEVLMTSEKQSFYKFLSRVLQGMSIIIENITTLNKNDLPHRICFKLWRKFSVKRGIQRTQNDSLLLLYQWHHHLDKFQSFNHCWIS